MKEKGNCERGVWKKNPLYTDTLRDQTRKYIWNLGSEINTLKLIHAHVLLENFRVPYFDTRRSRISHS